MLFHVAWDAAVAEKAAAQEKRVPEGVVAVADTALPWVCVLCLAEGHYHVQET